MTDYTTALYSLVLVTGLLTFGVVYVLRQPTDLPLIKKQGRTL